MSSLKSRFVSIPFDQGNVFRLQTLSFRAVFVSIPFDQGNVFRPNGVSSVIDLFVSIPFDQGNVFRQAQQFQSNERMMSQSLSIRAMSFDSRNKRS